MRRGSRSIVAQLTTWYAGSLFVIVLSATSYLYWALSSAITTQNASLLRDRLSAISSLVERGEAGLPTLRERIRSEWPSRSSGQVYVRAVDSRGRTVVESPGLPEEIAKGVYPHAPFAQDLAKHLSRQKLESETGGTYLAVARRFAAAGSSTGIATVYLALDLGPGEAVLASYLDRLLFALAASLFISVLLGRKLAVSAFRPVEIIAETMQRIRSSTLDERIGRDGLPIELQKLVGTVNEMLDRLEEAFTRLSRFSSDIAHELRTPVSNIQGEVEVALSKARSEADYREVLGSCLEEAGRLKKLIDSLLFIAQSEQPEAHIRRETIQAKQELLNIVDFYEASATDEKITISVAAPEDLRLSVDKTLFQRAVGNVLGNAISYNREGGTIQIQAKETPAGIEIEVIDTGQGIPQAELPRVFDRFHRVDPSRKANKLGGFGLGLTIVKTIMTLHQGRISIESEFETGTTVRLFFPAVPASPLPG